MIAEPIFWKYLIFNDDGEMTGIKANAPKDAKKAYIEYMEQEKKLRSASVKI